MPVLTEFRESMSMFLGTNYLYKFKAIDLGQAAKDSPEVDKDIKHYLKIKNDYNPHMNTLIQDFSNKYNISLEKIN